MPSDTHDHLLLSSGGPLFCHISLLYKLFWPFSFFSQLIIDPSTFFDICAFCFSFFLHFVDHGYPWFSWCNFHHANIVIQDSVLHLSPTIYYTACESIYSFYQIFAQSLLSHNFLSSYFSPNVILVSFSQLPFSHFCYKKIMVLIYVGIWDGLMSLILILKHCFTRM